MASAPEPAPEQQQQPEEADPLEEVLPKQGLLYSEKGALAELLCKPRIMPLKSVTLRKLEEMERKAAELASAAPAGDGQAL